MVPTVEIENIEQMRRAVGIEDKQLRSQIRQLSVGDHVKLTFLTNEERARSETVVVRITSITNKFFRGKLTETPSTLGEPKLKAGSLVTFKPTHIHSIPTANNRNEDDEDDEL